MVKNKKDSTEWKLVELLIHILSAEMYELQRKYYRDLIKNTKPKIVEGGG